AFWCFLNGSRTVQLLEEDAVLRSGSFENIKAMIAEPCDCFIVRARLSFLCHVSPCRRHDAYAALTLTCILRIDTLAHSCMPRQHYPCAESNPRPRVACGESAGATMETESSFYWVWFAMFLGIPQSPRDQQERTAEGGCATQMSFGFRPAKQKSRRFGILVGRTF